MCHGGPGVTSMVAGVAVPQAASGWSDSEEECDDAPIASGVIDGVQLMEQAVGEDAEAQDVSAVLLPKTDPCRGSGSAADTQVSLPVQELQGRDRERSPRRALTFAALAPRHVGLGPTLSFSGGRLPAVRAMPGCDWYQQLNLQWHMAAVSHCGEQRQTWNIDSLCGGMASEYFALEVYRL